MFILKFWLLLKRKQVLNLNNLQDILFKKFSNDDVGHFYLLTPGFVVNDKSYIRQWCLDLISTIMSDDKKKFNSENVLNHEDLLFIGKDEKDQTAYKLSDFTTLFSFLNYAASRYKRKIIIIDNAEKLSASVSNKLLKTLEEPPIKCTIFLLNSQKVALLDTVKSRAIKLTIPTPKQTSNLDAINGLIEEIKNGKTLDEFVASFKGNKLKEVELFKDLNDWMNKKSTNAALFQTLDYINKQTLEDHTYNAGPLNRLHKVYFLIKELIDG